MKKKKNYYTGLGLCMGVSIASIISVMGYVFTLNPLFFIIIGVGAAIGLIAGSSMDKDKNK